ncbi:ABC transporter ATP-binding protein [Pelagibacterium lacus]|uniref:ATP-binding cassette domain-containing protein n=1 Tax=Pelagibacterium lacus TaxID=2282655 RepID=A0A369W449_9HYPH|nr:ABC transporter ATP-binding protein [Pelagibacterium lacus]RDE09328.1 ATP-binding cassette domain-containing protein [Pelagibacterium lacus]
MSHFETALLVENVSKSYGEVKALQDVSLSVRRGEFVALLGPNGAGKSTLLQLLTGLFVPDSGHIAVLGKDMSRQATQALADIGVVFQQQTLDLELTVRANLLFHADLHGLGRALARERIAAILEEYGLSDVASARARTLSGGNRRRVELARARLHRPSVLLMDEATVGLDPNSRRALLEEVKRLTTEERISVLWTTHLIDEVQHADRMVMLDKGRVIYDGTAAALLEREGSDDLTQTILAMMGGKGPEVVLSRPAHDGLA